MQIRKMETQDLAALQELYLTSRQKTFDWQDPQTMTLADFERDTKDEVVYVAAENKKILGFISLYVPENFIHCLFIAENAQHQGIGQALLTKAKVVLDRPIRLKCLSKNISALTFYQKAGFQRVNEELADDPYWNLVYY